jgi:hypothetical protein
MRSRRGAGLSKGMRHHIEIGSSIAEPLQSGRPIRLSMSVEKKTRRKAARERRHSTCLPPVETKSLRGNPKLSSSSLLHHPAGRLHLAAEQLHREDNRFITQISKSSHRPIRVPRECGLQGQVQRGKGSVKYSGG